MILDSLIPSPSLQSALVSDYKNFKATSPDSERFFRVFLSEFLSDNQLDAYLLPEDFCDIQAQLDSIIAEISLTPVSSFDTTSNDAGNIDSLNSELQNINLKFAAFEKEKSAAITTLRDAISFDKDFVFSDNILSAAAFAKLFDKKTFSDFKVNIHNQIKVQGSEKFISDWTQAVRDKSADIQLRYSQLLAQQHSIHAKLTSHNFVNSHSALKDFVIPDGYCISEHGIDKIAGEKSLPVSRVPAFIQAKRKNFEDKTFKFVLTFLSDDGSWQSLPPTGAEIIFNARKLIDLAAYGFPVTSSNANLFVDFLDAFKSANDKLLPLSFNVSRCGWYHFLGQEFFVDPRRHSFISNSDRNIEVVVDEASSFARSFVSVGCLNEWRKAYDIAKKSSIARLIVASSLAAPLLKILGERNFVLYLHGHTRGGKSTCLFLGASAVGKSDLVISFDGTNTGLLARASESCDFPFFVDEKQSADKNLKEQFQRFIYSVANGIERIRANKDGSSKSVRDWHNITLCNGETELLDDNATGGAFTRLLQIHSPDIILNPDDCKSIRDIIKFNYGLAFPLVIDTLFQYGFDYLRDKFADLTYQFSRDFPNVLPEYCRYLAVITLADMLLNISLGSGEIAALTDSIDNSEKIFPLLPSIDDISDSQRERDFVLGFIAQNQKYFLGATSALIENLPYIYGKFDDDFVYITVTALKQLCNGAGFDYQKLVSDLLSDGFFVPCEKIASGRKKPYPFVLKKINGVNTNCYRIPKYKVISNS